ncbi:substrate-binding domain-containing protein [Roseovarius salinarum]|uniref:substrate-binding domain-containing protein n=1 Tax=Roseovarius salinarum TaxID=1981892 RepID=UPI001E5D0693|nr:substrate-binding domain-containing protein [Roseovarius salinarum]
MATAARAQDVTLTSRDGDVEISGDLLGFDGEFYRVETIYGELTVDGSGVLCEGPGCPNLEHYVARTTISGAPAMGRVLMPALIEAFALRRGMRSRRENLGPGRFRYVLSDSESGREVGRFSVRMTDSEEGFADLLANEADIVMSRRPVRDDELQRFREAGVGDLSEAARSRVLALDALVPLVAPDNPVAQIGLSELAGVLAGEVENWKALAPDKAPDAPIDVHLAEAQSGLGQAVRDQLLTPGGGGATPSANRHEAAREVAAAVVGDPFALGVGTLSASGSARKLALDGGCGQRLRATRQTVKTEDYPLTAPLFLYTPARRFPKLVREFLAFATSPEAQMVIRRAGFVDQAPEEIPIAAQGRRLANAVSNAGTEINLIELKRMIRVLSPLQRLTTTFRFEAGSVQLDPQSRSNVLRLARALERGTFDTRRLVFVGFSDGAGPTRANRRISRRRAEAVREAVLAAATTADTDRLEISTEAFGEAMPMACDDNAWGRRINRRVEIWVR